MYVGLHTHSYYSLLDGVPSPEALVEQAAAWGMPALALTDHDALYGAPRFAQAARQAGIKPIFGTELTLDNGGHLTLLAENDTGYANLCQLITLARRDQQKGYAALPWRYLAEHSAGLIALSGCRRGEIAQALLSRDGNRAWHVAERYLAIFGRENFFLELQRHHEHGDRRLAFGLMTLGRRLDVRLVATSNVHYLTPAEAPLQEILTCIRYRVPRDKAGDLLRPNEHYYFRSPDDMAKLFADYPDALQATLDIAERCHAQLPNGQQQFPAASVPAGQSELSYLRQRCREGLARKVGPQHQFPKYYAALEHELAIIAELGLVPYFLLVDDIGQFSRDNDILFQGRGSGANSVTAFSLGVTPIDPLTSGLVFERFLSHERKKPADIDIDFSAKRREKVIQYVYKKYGHDHAAMACTISTFGARQAVRDVGMALGFSAETLDRICEAIDSHSAASLPDSIRLRAIFGKQWDSPRWQQLFTLAAAIDSYPRHLGIHNGGMIISRTPLSQQIPIEPASMEDRTVVQWDKESLELAGWVKVDILGLRELDAINDACDIIEQQTGQRPDLSALPFDDPNVFAMIQRGETVGVFQLESRAQANLVWYYVPMTIGDITIMIALMRPGPVQGNVVHPVLRRHAGTEPVTYLHPLLKPILKDTYGVMLFQEDVLRVAHALAGFTEGEGELLRRALGNKRAGELVESFHQRFIEGAAAKGVSAAIAEQVFDQLRAFASYSFSKAHASAFAVLTYWSAWLRCYYPTAFFAGVLRNEPMGFYAPHVVVSDAQRVGVQFLPVDLRYSQVEVTVEGDAIRLGLNYVCGLGPEHIEVIEAERQRSPFRSVNDFLRRTQLGRRQAENLVLAGGLDYVGEPSQILWDLAEAFKLAKRPPTLSAYSNDETAALVPMTTAERHAAAFAATGVSLNAHLTESRRDIFTKAGAIPIKDLRQLRPGRMITIGGVVVSKQRPKTANGVTFLAIEDPGGIVNVVILPKVYEQYGDVINGPFVTIEGLLQNDHGAINIVAKKITRV